ncbi:uncharacterized protein LTR77_007378 [Saxophila tyrrhenica]|uniref:Heme oxygenase n=1 Tax=Saxophila tyrrhenica TaxID=1690608 RepID=A0AAV9P7V5_9PEZI|nr:hypothetical protein LTR77_007378 [Saxophila tyrrhenica]
MAGQLLTPSPSPSPPATQRTILPAEINAATRKQHTELNRLIVDRLPLALPPHQGTPALYGQGLAAFAEIYFTFEEVWSDLATSSKQRPGKNGDSYDTLVRQWLASLRPDELKRSARLQDDIKHLSSITNRRLGPLSARQLLVLQRMTEEIHAKPHTLIAYSWVMYMAIFSGGRWIRQELAKAGPEFWGQSLPTADDAGTQSSRDLLGISFLSFEGTHDGEDIKASYKSELVQAETLLTFQERQDVIEASQQLFEDCIALVGELDEVAQRQLVIEKAKTAAPWILAILLAGFCWLVFKGASSRI